MSEEKKVVTIPAKAAARYVGLSESTQANRCGRSRLKIVAADLTAGKCAAVGLGGTDATTVFDLRRKMVAAGKNPDSPMEVFRGATLVLRIESVGAGARLSPRLTAVPAVWDRSK